ncbi:MAG: FAD-binding protein [Myxococcota bacterium]|nr:FAD-binding protein [Myxococcota bacterium]
MALEPNLGWDEETDVLIVGLGGAGVCAAIEASQENARVTVLERFTGGGATAISGGVVYAGGGTHIQHEAGVEDDVSNMRAYLAQEAGGVVGEETLRKFCDESVESLRWLTDLGLQFEGSLCPQKTSYPNDDYFLYYSGNEAAHPYRERARPAPRGHRVKGKGLPGRNFFEPLYHHLQQSDADIRLHCRALELIQDEEGRVIGLSFSEIPPGRWAKLHGQIESLATKFALFTPSVSRVLRSWGSRIESRQGRTMKIRVKKGVILCTGGFINNRKMMEEHAPEYLAGLPIGTTGCSGDGIQMGQALGARTQHMDNISGWLFLNPPHAFIHGILIDREGKRFVNEALYGAVTGGALMEEAGGSGFLIIDEELRTRARSQLGGGQTQLFQTLPGLLNLLFNCKKAKNVEALARLCGCELESIKRTLKEYNDATQAGEVDAFRKEERQVLSPPYYVVPCSPGQWTWPLMMLTLGGLCVEEESGAVKNEAGEIIPGLYAAGRAAVGICSQNYVSGLSIADCVYSGRRAGRMAACQDKETR